MSRVGKQIITIPAGVTAALTPADQSAVLTIKGPGGTLTREFKSMIDIKLADNEIKLEPKVGTGLKEIELIPLWGTYASHVKNMVIGVTTGFTKLLLIEGVGFKAQVVGDTLNLDLGFSHPIKVKIPPTLTVTAEKGNLTVKGADKEEVGQFAATVRGYKKTEPYKGKGIRYSDEIVLRKQGKKNIA
ncbi:MAG: 50S ribosomal protein L6 [Candidatus Vogelbacteria bacterium GWA1_51_14]|uniref:50S ribosomal protein L6 n=1 Tax=Candidatus Vogelbacteria bacterium GWA1_51_14 TaxID=1802435 RepID=A0A1G2Q8D9_9BACT|nr:MAG: 50S ribosomal protein L6 [Candidatus Vogelbacteria bacterium GWA1_51_14]